MANKKISDGVGKKIVEALKKQSEIEINAVPSEEKQEELYISNEDLSNIFDSESKISDESFNEADFLENLSADDDLEKLVMPEEEPSINLESTLSQDPSSAQSQASSINIQSQPFYQQPAQPPMHDSFITELDSFEIPGNIAVLKKLITQLPSGVTRHTGAQIIKQTMEALGISMKSVLQEAQQVQDSLNNSAKECYSTIQEYKKQIMLLEKQAQNHQKQYGALNELISLFIQTGV